jgi:hypothetical protein
MQVREFTAGLRERARTAGKISKETNQSYDQKKERSTHRHVSAAKTALATGKSDECVPRRNARSRRGVS